MSWHLSRAKISIWCPPDSICDCRPESCHKPFLLPWYGMTFSSRAFLAVSLSFVPCYIFWQLTLTCLQCFVSGTRCNKKKSATGISVHPATKTREISITTFLLHQCRSWSRLYVGSLKEPTRICVERLRITNSSCIGSLKFAYPSLYRAPKIADSSFVESITMLRVRGFYTETRIMTCKGIRLNSGRPLQTLTPEERTWTSRH